MKSMTSLIIWISSCNNKTDFRNSYRSIIPINSKFVNRLVLIGWQQELLGKEENKHLNEPRGN